MIAMAAKIKAKPIGTQANVPEINAITAKNRSVKGRSRIALTKCPVKNPRMVKA